MVAMFLGVTHQFCNTLHVLFETYNHNSVAHLEAIVVAREQVHALAADARNIHAIYRTEVQLTQHLAVHRTVRNDNTAAHHLLRLVFLVPVHLYLRTNECRNSFSISLCTHYEHLVVKVQHGVF